jgi:ParB family transcriptional regulator, chromosome partitioning protein
MMEESKTQGPKKKGLGRGLGALIPTIENPKTEKRGFFYLAIEEVVPNPFQPRKKVKDADIDKLAESIKQNGIIQPLLVKKKDGGYQLIAGERRWRAAQRAGLTEVPAVLREAEAISQLELALIENIQRRNLNPMEEAEAYQRLVQEFGVSQEEVARQVSKDRTSISNSLRLLKLPPRIQEQISEGVLSFGHAKCLLGLESVEEQMQLAQEVIDHGLSVRELERLIKRKATISAKERTRPVPCEEDWVKEVISKLKTRVRLKRKKKGGALEIYFYSDEDLIRIVDLLLPK